MRHLLIACLLICATSLSLSQAKVGKFGLITEATIDTVASADTLSTGQGSVFWISGTTAISYITPRTGLDGQLVTLIFGSTSGLTDGKNLILNGNFRGAIGYTITLQRKGSLFYEVARTPGIEQIITPGVQADTLTTDELNSVYVVSYAGASTISLPTPAASLVGMKVKFVQTVDQNMLIKSVVADGNAIICDGVATTDLVTYSTASHKIGASCVATCISATKWFIESTNPACPPTVEAAD